LSTRALAKATLPAVAACLSTGALGQPALYRLLSGPVTLSASVFTLSTIGTPAILTIATKVAVADPVGVQIVIDIDVTAVDASVGPR
jgi:hypothetical protein